MSNANVPQSNVTQSSNAPSDAAFVLSVIGGVLIAIGSIAEMGLGLIGRPFFWGMMDGDGRMMGGYYYYNNAASSPYYYGMMYGLESLGLIIGVLVIVFALLMRSRPAERKTYGVLILIFSIISFVGMGGFFIGAVLGLIGGILALT